MSKVRHHVHMPRKPLNSPFTVTPNTGSSPPATALTPSQVRNAYKIPSNATGAGAKIAIIDLSPTSAYPQSKIQSDYQTFCTQYNLPTTGLTIYTYPTTRATVPTTTSGWGTEICLDIQWAHAIAPQAEIMLILVENPAAQTNSGLSAAIAYAVSLGANIVSMSFGMNEFSSELSAGFEPVFQNSNVTFIASAGDAGGELCYPACSQNVLAVGGTSLGIDSSGNYLGESAWISSGGGISRYVSYPTFQSSHLSLSPRPSGRAIPDIGFLGDPYTGVAVYCNEPPVSSPWIQVGGTSVGAPCWAGICALFYQKFGASSVGTARVQNLLYKYGTAVNASSYFNDVSIGESVTVSGGSVVVANACQKGYDCVTGVGTPNVGAFLALNSFA